MIYMTFSGQLNFQSYRAFVLLGDRKMIEESVWEAALFSAYYILSHLIAIVDRNRFQITDKTDALIKTELFTDQFTSFRCHIVKIIGHDIT
ncbi:MULTISPECIES: hypothetical protein [unclassified Bartonella]|uniref:hypothetical protein n=1 Tax=unclassified Bartonella TaxID=2645622 RepID=UPI0035D0AB2D